MQKEDHSSRSICQEQANQQSLLQKQLYQLAQARCKLKESVMKLQANSKNNQKELANLQIQHYKSSIKLSQMQQHEENIREDNLALQRQLTHMQSTLLQQNLNLDIIRKKYLLINNEIILDQQGQQVTNVLRKCKFFPSTAQNTFRKFSIQEYQKGFIIRKLFTQLGFSKISNQIAFPCRGIYESSFQLRQIARNEIILGVMSKSQPNSSDYSNLLYFNFRNQSIELNGILLQQFSCKLVEGQSIKLVVNMNQKAIIGMVDNVFEKYFDFSDHQIARQSLYVFMALSNDETVVYFQNT